MQFKITQAGRNALVNPPNTGTNAVLVAQIGITETAFTPAADGSDTVLPGEIKRISTISGEVVADDTIHVTMQDSTADAYNLRGFALYLADGTLFGLHGQSEVLLAKAQASMAMMSSDIKFADVDAAQIQFGDSIFSNPPATTEVVGVVELATNDEAIAGADSLRAMTPRANKAALDNRFGAGAPTSFAKSLLALATATAIRLALEIKSAALYATGHGNLLDADMVDGKHASDFATADHTHALSDLDGKVPITKGGTNADTAAAARLNLGAASVDVVAAAGVGSESGVRVTNTNVPWANSKVPAFWSAQSNASNMPATVNIAGIYVPHNATSGFYLAGAVENGATRLWARAISATGAGWSEVALLNRENAWTGNQSVTGIVSATSNIVAGGTLMSSGTVRTTTNAMVIGCGQSGVLNLRPLYSSDANQVSITTSGAIMASGGYQPYSSRDLKTAFRANPYGLDAVLRLETTLGKYRKWFNADGRERVFLIAENIADVMPQVAAGDGIEAKPPGETKPRKFKGYAIEQMLAVHTKAFQDLHAIVQAQGERIAALEKSA